MTFLTYIFRPQEGRISTSSNAYVEDDKKTVETWELDSRLASFNTVHVNSNK